MLKGLSNNRAALHKERGFLLVLALLIAGCSYNTIESGMTEYDYQMYQDGWQLEYIEDGKEGLRWSNGPSINGTSNTDI